MRASRSGKRRNQKVPSLTKTADGGKSNSFREDEIETTFAVCHDSLSWQMTDMRLAFEIDRWQIDIPIFLIKDWALFLSVFGIASIGWKSHVFQTMVKFVPFRSIPHLVLSPGSAYCRIHCAPNWHPEKTLTYQRRHRTLILCRWLTVEPPKVSLHCRLGVLCQIVWGCDTPTQDASICISHPLSNCSGSSISI
jgi:hypothetical protein